MSDSGNNRNSEDSKPGENKPRQDDARRNNKPGGGQGENTQGSKGQSGPERTQSDTMNSGARHPGSGRIGDRPASSNSGHGGEAFSAAVAPLLQAL